MSDGMPPKVVDMREWCQEQSGIVQMLEDMLEEAREGNLVGIAGCFLLQEYDGKPAIATFHSETMDDHFYVVVGALEEIKHAMLLEKHERPGEDYP